MGLLAAALGSRRTAPEREVDLWGWVSIAMATWTFVACFAAGALPRRVREEGDPPELARTSCREMMSAVIPAGWILFFVRVVTGIVLIYYGWPKIKNLSSNAQDFEGMGFRPGLLWGTLIAIVEFFGGIAMLAGVYAGLAASLFGFQMITGTFWKLKIGKPFTDYSYDLQLLALCTVMMAFGAGRYAIVSFDATVFLRWGVALGAIVAGALLAYLSKPRPS